MKDLTLQEICNLVFTVKPASPGEFVSDAEWKIISKGSGIEDWIYEDDSIVMLESPAATYNALQSNELKWTLIWCLLCPNQMDEDEVSWPQDYCGYLPCLTNSVEYKGVVWDFYDISSTCKAPTTQEFLTLLGGYKTQCHK